MTHSFLSKIAEFYFIDWVAIVCTFVRLYLLGSKNPYGFLFGAAANALWFVFGLLFHALGLIIANAVFCGLNIRAYLNWHKQNKEISDEKIVELKLNSETLLFQKNHNCGNHG